MLDEYFENKVEKVFGIFEEKYKLSASFKKNKVNYQSKIINFTIFFERSFEIYIVFILKNHKQTENIDLSSLVSYLNNESVDNTCLNRNQVSNEYDIDYVLTGLFNIMDIILDKIYNNKNLLCKAYMYQQHINQDKYNQYLIEQMSLELSKEWSSKNYRGFLEIYEKNKQRDKTIDIYLNEKQKKQLEYSKK